ncbi:MAG: hypothetical protein ACREOI_34375 [bacterium]
MIVLDEQLLGRNLERDIAKWYRGKVVFVTDLRPNSVIKDEALPELLRRCINPTFVTLNEKDFWHKVVVDKRYCVICFAWPDSRVREITPSLRSLFNRSEFKTKAKRMGNVVRVADEKIIYYTFYDRQFKALT